MTTSQFSITRAKGVALTFGNGYTVSIQWGPGNYCANYVLKNPESRDWDAPMKQAATGQWDSPDAECAVIDPDGNFCSHPGWGGDVKGYMSADEVAVLIVQVAALPAKAGAAAEKEG